jgi:hypothetical protein
MMGGGDTDRDETRRKIPGARAPGSDGAPGDEHPDFCAVPQEIAFEGPCAQVLHAGSPVRLQPQHLPLVVAGGRAIGAVPEPDATAMRHCLLEGYEMRGTIASYDSESGHGTLLIQGRLAGG